MKIDPKLLDRLEGFFLLPVVGGVTAAAGVLAGLVGAHYDKEVAAALLPLGWPGSRFAPEPSGFWLLVWLFGICFTGTFWAQARGAREATDSLRAATGAVDAKTQQLTRKTEALDGLVRQLHTLPPRGFLVEYRTAVDLANKAFFSVLDPQAAATLDELAAAIRIQLTCVLKLASAYDLEGNTAQYGCNLMLFREAAALSDTAVTALDRRMKFVDQGVTVRGLAGALDLLLPLSVASLSGGQPDPALRALAVPIPRGRASVIPSDAGDAGNLLPGAPLAFVNRTEAVIEGPDDWMRLSGAFSEPVRRELKAFIEDPSNTFQSFVSIPVYAPLGTPAHPLGVLNIHRDSPNPRLAEKMELFAPLIFPISAMMGKLLWLYQGKGPTL